MDKKILAVYITGGVLIVSIIAITIIAILGMQNKPINIVVTDLTNNMASDLLENYCKIKEEKANEYITKKEIKEAYLSLLNEETNVVLASDIDDETIKWLKANGVEIETIPIAKDALVFINSINNPIDTLTVNEIEGIYSGKYKNWNELNGNNEEIISYRANKTSEEEYMMKKFMGNKPLLAQKYEPKDSSLEGLINALSNYLDTSPKAITYTTFSKIKDRNESKIKILNIDGVNPNNNTIKTNQYEPVMNIYVVIRSNEPENSQTRKFVEYIKSKNGQAIIEQCGYVNLVK